jgi:hypothetical protein
LLNPNLVKLEWENPPSKDKNESCFLIGLRLVTKKRYGQFAPMIGENALLELFGESN